MTDEPKILTELLAQQKQIMEQLGAYGNKMEELIQQFPGNEMAEQLKREMAAMDEIAKPYQEMMRLAQETFAPQMKLMQEAMAMMKPQFDAMTAMATAMKPAIEAMQQASMAWIHLMPKPKDED